MIYPHNTSKQLEIELFKKPTAEYRGIPFWSWNCEITEELIDWQLDCFKLMGFGGVDIHPRTGLETEYLGKEYMRLIRYTMERCKEKGLFCWLYDEDRFPSGNAGGLVTKDFRLRGRYLLLTEAYGENYLSDGYYPDREQFEAAVCRGEKPMGYYATAYQLDLDGGYLNDYHRLKHADEIRQALEAGKRVRFAYVKMMEEEHWFEDQAYVDTMNPEAVAEFIRITHERYYQAVGDEFGKCVPAIFTDEPRMGKHLPVSAALSKEDITLPYTGPMAEQMRQRFGIDPLDVAPEYIWELPGGQHSSNRYYYRETAAECFVSAFLDQICDWCKEHDIGMTGHVLSEDSLYSQTFALGDCMRCYRRMDLPGIDVLADFRQFAAVKQAVSVARQYGREGTSSELYGVTHWDCSFKTYKLQGDWQAALGITIRIPHLSHMSLKGEAKRDWPASIFFQSPWYQEFPYVEDYFARLNTVLTRGKAVVPIAVIHPVESMWMYFGPNDQTAGIRRDMDEDFSRMMEWLLYGTLDFDFLSEALLPELELDGAEVLNVGAMTYQAVVVPGLKTIRSTTLDTLAAFRSRGGKVIFMGRIPDLVDARASDRPQRLADRCICIGKDRHELYAALAEVRDLEIRKADGCRSDNLFYQMREDGAERWLFVCHVNQVRNHLSAPEHYLITIKGLYDVTLFDGMTGEIHELPVRYENENTVMNRSLYGQDSILLRLQSRETDMREEAKPGQAADRPSYTITLDKPDACQRTEPNVLLLDYAGYRLDDGLIQEREEILRADNKIRGQLGFVLRKGRMNQPWFLEEKETHQVTLYYDVFSEIETAACLAIEDVGQCRVLLNGQAADMTVAGYYVDPDIKVINLPKVQKGKNELIVEMKYHQKTGLENLFILGDFDVELRGTSAVIRERGKQLLLGDITRQGMPFYTGNLEYLFHFQAAAGAYSYELHIPHYQAPVLAVFVDGVKKGLIAYAPHRLQLGCLSPGQHEITICLYGNRFNGFGTLHNADDELVWYGPDSYRTTGDAWSDSYFVRPVGILSYLELKATPC